MTHAAFVDDTLITADRSTQADWHKDTSIFPHWLRAQLRALGLANTTQAFLRLITGPSKKQEPRLHWQTSATAPTIVFRPARARN